MYYRQSKNVQGHQINIQKSHLSYDDGHSSHFLSFFCIWHVECLEDILSNSPSSSSDGCWTMRLATMRLLCCARTLFNGHSLRHSINYDGSNQLLEILMSMTHYIGSECYIKRDELSLTTMNCHVAFSHRWVSHRLFKKRVFSVLELQQCNHFAEYFLLVKE